MPDLAEVLAEFDSFGNSLDDKRAVLNQVRETFGPTAEMDRIEYGRVARETPDPEVRRAFKALADPAEIDVPALQARASKARDDQRALVRAAAEASVSLAAFAALGQAIQSGGTVVVEASNE